MHAPVVLLCFIRVNPPFSSFGHLKRVRMPTKFDNKSHRGFAFVDFTTKEEAKAALESLSNSHLYGRKLVLEFSTESQEGVDAMREKTKRYYSTGGGDGDTAKRIKSLGEDEDGIDGNESG